MSLDDIKINFIIGPGRSGTSLLVVLFNQFPNCVATPEIHHFIYFYDKYKDIKTIDQFVIDDYKRYISLFFSLTKKPLIGPVNYALLDSLKPGQAINYNQLTKLIYLCLFGEKGSNNTIHVIVDKNPYYTFHIEKIMTVFPEAKLIAMARDYRAYILSNRQSQKPFVKKRSVMYYACVWNMYLQHLWAAKQKYKGAVKIVNYEDMVLQKERTVSDIVQFFGLEYSESIFGFYLAVKQKLNEIKLPAKQHERMIKKIKDLSSPINAERVYAWKTAMKRKDIEKADFISGNTGKKYGYVPETEAGFLKKIFFSVIGLWPFLRVKSFEYFQTPRLHFYKIYRPKEF